jgi:hypothetical protein
MGTGARRRLAGAAAVLALSLGVAALLAAPTAAAGKPAGPRPDLAISAVTIGPPSYAFKDEPATPIRFCAEVSNVGAGRSGRILIAMSLHGPGTFDTVAFRRIAPLAGKSRPRKGPPVTDSDTGCGTGVSLPVDVPPGAYDVEVCALDRGGRERSRRNNCVTKRKRFFVIRRTWSAVISGTGRFLGGEPNSESWQTNNAVFRFTRHQQRFGNFVYTMSGSVSYRAAQGFDTGCNRQGAQTDFNPSATLTLDYKQENYTLIGRVAEGFRYAVVGLCEPAEGPAQPIFVDSGIGTRGPRPLAFGTEQIADSYTNLSETTFNWILR